LIFSPPAYICIAFDSFPPENLKLNSKLLEFLEHHMIIQLGKLELGKDHKNDKLLKCHHYDLTDKQYASD